MATSLEYGAVKILLGFAAIAPRSWIYGVMHAVSSLFYHASKKRRKITIDNLEHAFPELGREEVEKLSKDVYTELSVTASDILLMLAGRLDIDEMVINKDEALEQFNWLKAHGGNGVIFLAAHYSNWELSALFASRHGFPMTVIGRRGDNHLIDERIVIPFRTRYGNQTVYKKKAGIAMLRTLKKGGMVGLLIDQKVNKENGFLVPFFGRDAFTTHSIATLKLKADPIIIPATMLRVKPGHYRFVFGEIIAYKAEDIPDEEGKLFAMSRRYNQALEEIIRVQPAQWFWMHDRWNKRV